MEGQTERQTDRQMDNGSDFIGCCPTNVECPIAIYDRTVFIIVSIVIKIVSLLVNEYLLMERYNVLDFQRVQYHAAASKVSLKRKCPSGRTTLCQIIIKTICGEPFSFLI